MIWASLPITANEAIPWDVGAPDTNAMAITEVNVNPLWKPWESVPQRSGSHMGTLIRHWITPECLLPLTLPAECLPTTERDSMLETEGESSSSESSKSGSNEVYPLSQISKM